MKTVIAGSREITDYTIVLQAMEKAKEQGIIPTVVISGGARGVDRLGEKFALDNDLPIERFVPDWDGLGKAAGYIRNAQMAAAGDALVAIWDGVSRGTQQMIKCALDKGLKVYVHRTDKQ